MNTSSDFAAEGDTFKFKHSQSGRVSVARRHRPVDAQEVLVRSECPPGTLVSSMARCQVDDAGATAAESPSTLFAQLGACRYRHVDENSGELQILSGRVFLRTETVLVSGGLPHFSAHSLLAPRPLLARSSVHQHRQQKQPRAGVPTITGRPTSSLLSRLTDSDLEGACLFVSTDATNDDGGSGRGVLELGSRQQLLRETQLDLCGGAGRHPVDWLARSPAPANGSPAPEEEEDAGASMELLQRHRQHWMSSAQQRDSEKTASTTAAPIAAPTLLLHGGRCLLSRDGSLLILSGLLHFNGAWHRCGDRPSLRPGIVGSPVGAARTKEGGQNQLVGEQPALLSNVRLYAQGGTVLLGDAAILTDAVVVLKPEEEEEAKSVPLSQQASSQSTLRLFLRAADFSLDGLADGGSTLTADSGTAWMRGQRVRPGAGGGSGGSLLVSGGLAFEAGPSAQHRGRDVLFKIEDGGDLSPGGGLLLLDDMTPLMRGGRISVGEHRDVPLEWLSGEDPPKSKEIRHHASINPQSAKSGSHTANREASEGTAVSQVVNSPSSLDTAEAETELVADSTCLYTANGVHLLRGRLRLANETVLIDRGLAHFPAGSGLFVVGAGASPVGFAPPTIVGRPVTRPSATRRWAARLDASGERSIFEGVRLTVRGDVLWLNGRLPLLKDLRLVLNERKFAGPQLLAGAGPPRLFQAPGFSGTYSVFSGGASLDVTVFSLKARFSDALSFLSGASA